MPFSLPDPDDPALRELLAELDAAEPPSDEELDDGALDDAFPLGDGTADTTAIVVCPYCGETAEIAVDPGGGSLQRYVEDCPVCCQPWSLTVRWDGTGAASADCEADDALLD